MLSFLEIFPGADIAFKGHPRSSVIRSFDKSCLTLLALQCHFDCTCLSFRVQHDTGWK